MTESGLGSGTAQTPSFLRWQSEMVTLKDKNTYKGYRENQTKRIMEEIEMSVTAEIKGTLTWAVVEKGSG